MAVMKPIDIFKPGKHVAASGDAFNFSESDVAAMVRAYDPAKHEAPIVVGHPKHDGPAYGWVKSLEFAGGVIRAEPDQVDAAFAELVGAGRFKKISASFYHPESASNPVPGVYYLRHVGFLGAQPPAVKGLRNPEFNEADEKIVSFDFSEQGYAWSSLASMFRALREYVIGKDGADKADQLIPNWQIDQMQRSADEIRKEELDDEVAATAVPAFSDPVKPPTLTPPIVKGTEMTPEEIAALQAENTRLKADADAVAATIAAAGQAQRHTVNAAFCEQLVTDAKLHPKLKDNAVAFLNAMSTEQVVEFAEADGKKSDKTMADAFRAFLTAQPKIVEFGESGAGKRSGIDVDDSAAVAQKAVEFQESEAKAGRQVNTAQAVQHVMNG